MNDLAEDRITAEWRRATHDLSNLIMVVQGNLELMRMKLPRGGKLWSQLELASDAAERCRALTARLRALSSQPDPKR